jgi:hypothetical protein|tara:strand:- start:7771 stop:8529 length:759 start_codon:yes stop_codon:yes gene_type:complete
MSWAGNRRTTYFGAVVLVLLFIIGVPIFFLLDREPSCSDGIQNQDEEGVDCGGSCQAVCAVQVSEPVVLWVRALEVVPGVYNAVARVENSNFDAGVSSAQYTFTLVDDEGLLVAKRNGRTFISPNSTFVIFEGGIETGNRVPSRSFFEFVGELSWIVTPRATLPKVQNEVLTGEDASPRLTSTLENTTSRDMFDIEVAAIIFDREDNVIAASKTTASRIDKHDTQDVVFTWPNPFIREVSRIEITPRVPFGN